MSIFFDPSGAEFSISMRGYDRNQVDAYARRMSTAVTNAEAGCIEAQNELSKVHTAIRRNEDRLAGLDRQLADVSAQIAENEQPTLAGLGARIETDLRACEHDADQQRDDARQLAVIMREEAKVEAARTIDTANADATLLTVAARREAEDLDVAVKTETSELTESARRDADRLRGDAVRDLEQKRSTAQKETAEIKAGAERDIAADRAAADRESTQLRATVARRAENERAAAANLLSEVAETKKTRLQELAFSLAERREQVERDHSQRHNQAVAQVQNIVAAAQQRWTLADQHARDKRQKAEDHESQADRRAEELNAQTAEAVAAIVATARSQAEQLRTEAAVAAAELEQPLRDEIGELKRREVAVSSNLDDLRRRLGTVASEWSAADPNDLADSPSVPLPTQGSDYPPPTPHIPAID